MDPTKGGRVMSDTNREGCPTHNKPMHEHCWACEADDLRARLAAAEQRAEDYLEANYALIDDMAKMERWAAIWKRCAKYSRRRMQHTTGVYPRTTQAWENAWGYSIRILSGKLEGGE